MPRSVVGFCFPDNGLVVPGRTYPIGGDVKCRSNNRLCGILFVDSFNKTGVLNPMSVTHSILQAIPALQEQTDTLSQATTVSALVLAVWHLVQAELPYEAREQQWNRKWRYGNISQSSEYRNRLHHSLHPIRAIAVSFRALVWFLAARVDLLVSMPWWTNQKSQYGSAYR
jgi:hypothetical protein